MKNQKRFKNKQMSDAEIEIYCQGVDEVLTKIKDRCGAKEKRKEITEDRSMQNCYSRKIVFIRETSTS